MEGHFHIHIYVPKYKLTIGSFFPLNTQVEGLREKASLQLDI